MLVDRLEFAVCTRFSYDVGLHVDTPGTKTHEHVKSVYLIMFSVGNYHVIFGSVLSASPTTSTPYSAAFLPHSPLRFSLFF